MRRPLRLIASQVATQAAHGEETTPAAGWSLQERRPTVRPWLKYKDAHSSLSTCLAHGALVLGWEKMRKGQSR